MVIHLTHTCSVVQLSVVLHFHEFVSRCCVRRQCTALDPQKNSVPAPPPEHFDKLIFFRSNGGLPRRRLLTRFTPAVHGQVLVEHEKLSGHFETFSLHTFASFRCVCCFVLAFWFERAPTSLEIGACLVITLVSAFHTRAPI